MNCSVFLFFPEVNSISRKQQLRYRYYMEGKMGGKDMRGTFHHMIGHEFPLTALESGGNRIPNPVLQRIRCDMITCTKVKRINTYVGKV